MPDAPKAKNASSRFERIGGRVKLECEAPSVPSSRYEWFRTNESSVIIHENVKNYQHKSLLSVSLVLFLECKLKRLNFTFKWIFQVELTSDESFKNYTCKATNTHGTQDYLFILQQEVDSGSTNNQLSVSILFFSLTGILVKFVF